ncbi:MAG: TonB-dependent receptor plug domain-containing protein [Gemmatimonadetes bacterium]|nr:TonB-dependent receptor plug domain-containing protein [Gemmatimonadota bacterium]
MSRTRRCWSAALLLSLSCSIAAGAQVIPARPDTLPRLRAPQDTAPRPIRRDTLPGWPYLARGVVPTTPEVVPPAPLPPGSRYTFTRDSIPWSTAQTLADLLGAIPGVYLARAGFLGLPEYVVYGGRGAAALQVSWDGLPLEPLGGDSVYLDPSQIPLTYLRRVDVEMLPAQLRVYLVSERHETLPPRSVVRVMSGDFRTASYTGLFQKRWSSGLGLNLAGNFLTSEGASQSNRESQAFDLWAKGEWLPTATTGVAYQIRRQQSDRDAVRQGEGVVPVVERVPARHGARTDALFTVFAGSRPYDLGFRGSAGLGTSRWSQDSVLGDRQVRQAFGTMAYRGARVVVEATGRLADARTTSALEARVGWSPLPGIAAAADAALRRHEGDRRSRAAHVSAALYRGPFSVVAQWAVQDGVQAPALLADTAQETADRALRIGFDTRPLTGHLALVRRDAYQPLSFGELPVIPALAATRAATYLVADARLQPIKALTLDGWYATPRDAGPRGAADFQPPTHGRAQLTFRSKFWRTFRSGAFDLKVQIAMESWSGGTAGLDAGGAPRLLEGVTLWETFLAFRIVGFTMFWDLRDAVTTQTEKQYVPGLNYPHNAQVFGVRWEFRN